MDNNFNGFHQLPNKFAAVSDTFLTGLHEVRETLAFFLGKAFEEGVRDTLHCGGRLSGEEAVLWPRLPGMRTWCLNLESGDGRADLLPAPPGFLVTRGSRTLPVYLHYRTLPIGAAYASPAFHLIGGLHRREHRELHNGNVEVSVGTFRTNPGLIRPGGTMVQIYLPERGDVFDYSTRNLAFAIDAKERVRP